MTSLHAVVLSRNVLRFTAGVKGDCNCCSCCGVEDDDDDDVAVDAASALAAVSVTKTGGGNAYAETRGAAGISKRDCKGMCASVRGAENIVDC